VAAARARLDAVAYGTGVVGLPEIALAGLATAVGLPAVIYPGFGGSAARRQVARAAHGARSAPEVKAVSPSVSGTTDAATRAATDAAVRAATDAAVQASIDAATQAAISAATDAAHSAAHSAAHHAAGGGHAGGHH